MWVYDFNHNSFDADIFAQRLSGHTPVPIPYSPPPNYALIGTVAAISFSTVLAYVLFGSYIAAVLTSRWVWGAGSLGFIVVMLAGFMFVRIRSSPYFQMVRGPGGAPTLSYIAGGYQNQLGAETHIIGGLYAVLAISQIMILQYAPRVPSHMRQRAAVWIWLSVSWILFSVLVAVFRMKHPGTLAIPQHAPTARQPSPSTSYHNPFDAQAPGSAYSGGRARQRQLYQVTASEALGQSRSPSPESRQPEDPSSSLIPPAAHRLVPLTNRTQAKDSSRQNPFGRTTSPPLATRTTTMPTSGRRVAFSASAPWQSFNDIRTERGRTWKLLLTYGGDWVLTIGLTAAFFMLDGVEGFKREFDLNDTS
ncbi:oligosaccharyl transferase subunit ost3/OST6, partial [Tulasnella sp. 403]